MKSSSITSFEENSIEESSFENESDLDESIGVSYEHDQHENSIRYSNSNYNNDTYPKIGKNQVNSSTKINTQLKSIRKRKCRTTFNKHQLNTLENEFLKSNFVSYDRIHDLMEATGLDSRIIKVIVYFI
jgi:hypothetical protein